MKVAVARIVYAVLAECMTNGKHDPAREGINFQLPLTARTRRVSVEPCLTSLTSETACCKYCPVS